MEVPQQPESVVPAWLLWPEAVALMMFGDTSVLQRPADAARKPGDLDKLANVTVFIELDEEARERRAMGALAISSQEAERRLFQHLEGGRGAAQGREGAGTRLVDIPAAEWSNPAIVWNDTFDLSAAATPRTVLYHDIRIASASLPGVAVSASSPMPDAIAIPPTRAAASWPGFAATRTTLNTFWLDSARKSWPASTSDLLFLGEAVSQLGAALFPGDWSSEDPSLPLPTGRAVQAKPTAHGEIDLATARAAADEHARALAWHRHAKVIDMIVEAARKGSIELFHGHPDFADDPQPFKDVWLQYPGLDHLFEACRINIDNPHRANQSPYSGDSRNIYVERRGFEALLAKLGVRETGGQQSSPPPSTNSDRNGLPGRPTAAHILEDILERRHAAGQMIGSNLAGECREVLRIFKADRANAHIPNPTQKTAENRLRELYRRLERTPQN